MALKSTIYKVDLQIADMDRHYYANHALTVARHPSENDERMMVRVLAFARHASETLAFTRGLSEPDEPELWQRDLTDAIELWIDLGNPDVETSAVIADRIRHGLKYVSADRLVPAPDCGMKYMPRHIAFGKLKAMSDAAAMVRKEIS